MKLDIIENSGPDNLRDTLNSQLSRTSTVYIAVAFVTQSGLQEILPSLRQVANSGSVRLLTGLYQKVTEPLALRTLLRVQKETRGRLAVRLSREPQFHRKLYVMRKGSNSIAVLGSSNLTREGLRSGGELNLMVRLPNNSSVIRRINQGFEDDWAHQAVPLTAEQIVEYEKARPKTPKSGNYTKEQLQKILGATPIHRQATEELLIRKYWRDGVTGVIKKRTEAVISATTNWDDKNFLYFTPGGQHPYKMGDHIVLFGYHNKRIELIEVKDIAHLKMPTPDGRHFVAYKPLFKWRRRFSEKLWTALADEGVTKKNAKDRRKLNTLKMERLKALIRTPKGKRLN